MSNMQFVSKLVERAAADQLQSHLGKLLDWFASFLSNRSQNVTVSGVFSDRFSIDFGAP